MFNLTLSFHILDSLNLIALEVAIHIDDNGNGNSTFGCGNTNHKESHKHAFHTVGIKQTVDGGEVDIDGIEHQLDRDEHGNQRTEAHSARNNTQQVSLLILLSCYY